MLLTVQAMIAAMPSTAPMLKKSWAGVQPLISRMVCNLRLLGIWNTARGSSRFAAVHIASITKRSMVIGEYDFPGLIFDLGMGRNGQCPPR